MKKILLSTVALLGLSAAASAADLPRRTYAPAPAFVAAPVFTWSGFYVGGNIGGAWRNNNDDAVFVAPNTIVNTNTGGTFATTGAFAFSDKNDSGVTGGAQVGYNMQFGAFVVGVEADIQAADLNARNGGFYTFTGTADGIPGLATGTTVVLRDQRDIDWWGSVRARAGFAFDRFLVYGTGGFAFGGGSNNCGGFVGCGDNTRGGWAAGGGVEYAWTNNMTVGVEGLFVSLGHDNFRGAAFNPTTNTLFLGTNQDDDFTVVRAKLNWKF